MRLDMLGPGLLCCSTLMKRMSRPMCSCSSKSQLSAQPNPLAEVDKSTKSDCTAWIFLHFASIGVTGGWSTIGGHANWLLQVHGQEPQWHVCLWHTVRYRVWSGRWVRGKWWPTIRRTRKVSKSSCGASFWRGTKFSRYIITQFPYIAHRVHSNRPCVLMYQPAKVYQLCRLSIVTYTKQCKFKCILHGLGIVKI